MSRHVNQMKLYEDFDSLPVMFKQELTSIFFDLSHDEEYALFKALLASDLGDDIVVKKLKESLAVFEDQKEDLRELKQGGYKGVF